MTEEKKTAKKVSALDKVIVELSSTIADYEEYKIIDEDEFTTSVKDALIDILSGRLYLKDKEERGIIEKV